MQAEGPRTRSLPFMAVTIFVCAVLLAGCDEGIVTFRDTTIPIPKHATWAWRPMPVKSAEVRREIRRDHRAQNPADNRPVDNRPVDNRPVTSRDVIDAQDEGPQQQYPQQGGPQGGPNGPRVGAAVLEPDSANEAVRQQARAAIEQELAHKGFTKVDDPGAADFLVDYHLAVHSRDVTRVRGYGGYGYGGPVCGPYGCWNTWGYGPPDLHYENVRFREGTFVFDFLKANSLQLAYRATGQEPAHKGNFSQDNVQEMIHNLLKSLKGK
ncbi:MAG TPA: DUF4136 domain-containing protein [Candidatus Dormibacteraeota bacterium]|nr:DUF4136 domain-containing protein [Candidatus Dormibacteraeota bacterium]